MCAGYIFCVKINLYYFLLVPLKQVCEIACVCKECIINHQPTSYMADNASIDVFLCKVTDALLNCEYNVGLCKIDEILSLYLILIITKFISEINFYICFGFVANNLT